MENNCQRRSDKLKQVNHIALATCVGLKKCVQIMILKYVFGLNCVRIIEVRLYFRKSLINRTRNFILHFLYNFSFNKLHFTTTTVDVLFIHFHSHYLSNYTKYSINRVFIISMKNNDNHSF